MQNFINEMFKDSFQYLLDAEEYYRKEYDKALCIKNSTECKEKILEISNQIRKIKNILQELEEIKEKISTINFKNKRSDVVDINRSRRKLNKKEKIQNKEASKYEPLEKQLDYSKENIKNIETLKYKNINNKNKKLKSITFNNIEYETSNYSDALIYVCNRLILYKPFIISNIKEYSQVNTIKNIYFSYKLNDIKKKPKQLTNGIWVETEIDKVTALRIIDILMKKCGFSKNILCINTEE